MSDSGQVAGQQSPSFPWAALRSPRVIASLLGVVAVYGGFVGGAGYFSIKNAQSHWAKNDQILMSVLRSTRDELLGKPQTIEPLTNGANQAVVFIQDGKKCVVAYRPEFIGTTDKMTIVCAP